MHKSLLLTFMLAAAGGAALHAQTGAAPVPASAPAPAVAFTAAASLASEYMFRGQRLGGLSVQPAIEMAAGNSTLGFWSSFPLQDKVPDTSDPELNLYGSHALALADGLSLAPGFTWYVFPRAPIGAGFYRSTFEPNLALNYTVQGLKLTPKVYYDVTLQGPTYELTANYAVPLTQLGTELGFVGTVGTYYLRDAVRNDEPRTKLWGEYYLVGVSAPFQLTPNLKLTFGWAYTEGRDAFAKRGTFGKVPNALVAGRGVGTVSLSCSF